MTRRLIPVDIQALRRQCVIALLLVSSVLPVAASACPLVLPPVRDLDLTRFYSDEAGSIADAGLVAQHKSETATVREFLNRTTKEADAAYRQETPSLGTYRAQCALDWLETWAQGGALLGKFSSKQAEAERRWTLAGAALAYLKVKTHAKPGQRTAIETWLLDLARISRTAFDDPGIKRNNHWYWMGLGLGATALATGNTDVWHQARAILKEAAGSVAADGHLPQELARKSRALHYHAFALMPLMTLAELVLAKGETLTPEEQQSLERLVSLTARGLVDPQIFDTLAGFEQERPIKPGSGWLALYEARHASAFPGFELEMPSGHRWLGGNVLLLRKALALTLPEH